MKFEIININEITAAEYAAVLSRQSAAGRERLEALRPADRKRSLAARFLAGRLAAEIYGKADFAPFFDENGAPRAEFCYLSLSHAGEYAACAVSERPVGIDIEPEKPFKRREKYMLFSALESEFVNAAEETAAWRFYTLWTRKEAFVKAAGQRLADAAAAELVAPGGLKNEFEGYAFQSSVYKNYYIAVCEKLP